MKFVYVIYDPLRERVICVHEEENMECDKCKDYLDNDGYGINEQKFYIEPSKKTMRDEKLNQIISDDSVADVKKNFLSPNPTGTHH
jgi:hypothetical protein